MRCSLRNRAFRPNFFIRRGLFPRSTSGIPRVRPNKLCFCPISLCLVLQMQPGLLGLCTSMPNYAAYFTKDEQVKCRKMPKSSAPRERPNFPENAHNCPIMPKIPSKVPKFPAYAFSFACYAKQKQFLHVRPYNVQLFNESPNRAINIWNRP